LFRIVEDDLPTFAALATEWLHRDPVRNNALCTITQTRLDGLLPLEPDALWLRLIGGPGNDTRDNTGNDDDGNDDGNDDGGDTGSDTGSGDLDGVAICTPPRGLLLSDMSAGGATAMADHLAPVRQDLPTVDGPQEPAGIFARRFAQSTGRGAVEGLSGRMYRLDAVVEPNGVPGRMREAEPRDRDLLIAWLDAFSAEALPHQTAQTSAATGDLVDRRLGQRGFLWLWEHAGQTVSLLMVSRPAAGVVRVGAVYTPPELRGHGYASGNVAAICQRSIDGGATACMLYTDRANPTSNRVYQRIGFRPVGDTQEWIFRD
jgi:RimJ/RimL family protein N-acetyltransferase